jgi:integral membrane protein (TIGR01906 family)
MSTIRRLQQTLVSLLLALLVPLLLVMIGARLMMIPAYLAFEYQRPDFPPDDYGFTLQDRLHYGPYALDYLVYNAPINLLADLRFSDGRSFFNARELGHMVDVQRVAQALFAGAAAVGILCAVLILFLARDAAGRRRLRQALTGGALLTLFLIGGLAIFVLLAWDRFFTQFHELFFSSGSWIFEYTDSLIRLYPVRFWQDTAVNIGILSAAGALLLLIAVRLWARRAYQQEESL